MGEYNSLLQSQSLPPQTNPQLGIFQTHRGGFSHILHQATGSRSYTDKTRLRGFQTLNFVLVRVGGLRLYSRDF